MWVHKMDGDGCRDGTCAMQLLCWGSPARSPRAGNTPGHLFAPGGNKAGWKLSLSAAFFPLTWACKAHDAEERDAIILGGPWGQFAAPAVLPDSVTGATTRWVTPAGQRQRPHCWHLCSETTPCRWAVPPGYSLFQALCWAAAGAAFIASSLPSHPVHCSVALPVIPMTFFEYFHFPTATFSCQLVNMVIIHGAHIKAKLSWYSSFHKLLSPHVPQSSVFFHPVPFISAASNTATLFVLSALAHAIDDTAYCRACNRQIPIWLLRH